MTTKSLLVPGDPDEAKDKALQEWYSKHFSYLYLNKENLDAVGCLSFSDRFIQPKPSLA